MRPRRLALMLFGALLSGGVLVGGGVAGAGSQWVTYHSDAARTGVDSSEPSLNPIGVAWSNVLDGASIYGQPVVAAGRVFVGTEDDNVYALDAHDGHVLWHANIGTPFDNGTVPGLCGNIDPLGITSTPVVDVARSTVYVAGETSNGGAPPVSYHLVGFNIFTGAVVVNLNAAPPVSGDEAVHLQQRAALALGNGRVYVSYGGHDGDCGTYHGWIVGVDELGHRPNVQFNVTPQSTGGAIWNGGGGPSIDSAGNVYVVTGNPNSGGPAPWAEAVVKLDPNLDSPPLASFQDAAATDDLDLGTGDALLLPNGDLFTVGKTNIGYLLSQANLHQVHAISGTVCASDPDGGGAYDAATNSVYIPCRGGGIQQVNLTTVQTGWRAGSVNGAPILVAGNLWALQYNGGLLRELNPANGAVIQSRQMPATVPTFSSPSSADGLLLVGTDNGVVALDGPAGPPPPAPPPPPSTFGYWMVASDGGLFSFGTAAFHGSLGGVRLNAPIVGMAPTPTGKGYWLVAADGGVFTFGDARFFGSTGGIHLAAPIVGMAAAPNGSGYWLVARDGGVFTFGPGAKFYGSTGGIRLNRPVVGMAGDPATGGYWLVASDGGVFSFHAPFFGSTGSVRLDQPVVGMAAEPHGSGYWLAASDGGVFTFGPGARFHGSTGGVRLNQRVVGMAVDSATGGYLLVASDGGVFTFNAPFEGSTGGLPLVRPVVGIAVPRSV